ncbi:uncharacterized protein K444DRAFT_627851 [Hyaloscypha bicolor E]|uniref:Uncharacterized protein n=1 Tax=Hyaloscypha bicolor E TaxID=1095630 RepID=A0A2J6TJ37_9HELO|nr:uncharacterized protein K444DRAFT_627851 [Hyaloscypha bicolor E]PMD62998.1 hypothetical protein K444DRAFT_627851 [Hyaloscypha bicolor E]
MGGTELIAQPDYKLSKAQVYVNFAVAVTKRRRVCASYLLSSMLARQVSTSFQHGCLTAAPGGDDLDVNPKIVRSNVLRVRGFMMEDTGFAFSEIMDQNQLIVTSLETELQKKIPFLMDHLRNIVVSSDTVESPTE